MNRIPLSEARQLVVILASIMMWSISFAGTRPARAYSDRSAMMLVEGGPYVPFAKENGRAIRIRIKSFYMDLRPVTNSEFLEFVEQNPQWRKSRIPRVFADQNYLRNWSGDLTPGPDDPPNSPVTFVSWFAARAYCIWVGKRLPTIDEWEFAASKGVRHESDQQVLNTDLNHWYVTGQITERKRKIEGENAALSSMNTQKLWEWVEDFSNVVLTEKSDVGILTCGGSSAAFTDPMNYAAFARYSFRSGLKANYCLPNLGFRAVRSVNNEMRAMK